MADDWKYAVEDFEDPDDDGGDGTAVDSTGGRATDVFGETGGPEEIEPGSPSFENALFVLVGVAIALVIVLGI